MIGHMCKPMIVIRGEWVCACGRKFDCCGREIDEHFGESPFAIALRAEINHPTIGERIGMISADKAILARGEK